MSQFLVPRDARRWYVDRAPSLHALDARSRSPFHDAARRSGGAPGANWDRGCAPGERMAAKSRRHALACRRVCSGAAWPTAQALRSLTRVCTLETKRHARQRAGLDGSLLGSSSTMSRRHMTQQMGLAPPAAMSTPPETREEGGRRGRERPRSALIGQGKPGSTSVRGPRVAPGRGKPEAAWQGSYARVTPWLKRRLKLDFSKASASIVVLTTPPLKLGGLPRGG